jgi:hypothetical protein
MVPARRFDLDWLRIGAFALLILYHTGMFYVSWDWHVKSRFAGPSLEPLMLSVNPWRLDLLFFISGVATRFLSDRTTPGALARNRFHRLFWPLIFAMFVIVPPQAFLEIVTKINYPDSYWDFYLLYATGQGHWCREDCMIVPTWNHMWFVAYLLVYSLILCAGMALWPKRGQDASPRPTPAWIGPAFLILPWLYLWAARYWLLPIFGITHALVNDFYAHASYGALFVLGFMVAKNEVIFETATRFRHAALILALLGFCGVLFIRALPDEQFNASPLYPIFGRGVHELQAWAAIIALLGYARHHLANADGPWRRWLTKAVFPFYIIHQTVIVVAAYQLDRLALPLVIEVSILLSITFAACFATAWIAGRSKPLGVVLGWAP